MYAYATGGPFGLEDMVTTSGPGLTLLYHLFIPLFWCIPVSLVAAELTTAIPVEGGFYRWVRAGFGDFWGFLAGWWNWSASFLLAAAYAVLFADYVSGYLSVYFAPVGNGTHYAIAAALIALIGYLNVRGIHMVGAVATVLEVFVLVVVGALCVVAALEWRYNPFSPLVPPHAPKFQVFGAGLALGLWLYSGYEQLSSVAEEVEQPQKRIRGHWRSLCRFPLPRTFFRRFFRLPPSGIGRDGIRAISQAPPNSSAAPGWPFPSRSRQ